MTTPAPSPHPTTELLYDALGPGITAGDDGTLRDWLNGAVSLLGEVDDVVRDSDEGPGWAVLLDPDVSPDPRFLAQFVGVAVPQGVNYRRTFGIYTDDYLDEYLPGPAVTTTTITDARQLIRARSAVRRGTPEALRAAARPYLVGDKRVEIDERTTSAYALTVRTFVSETPDAVMTEAAILDAKPAGLVLTYQLIDD